MVPYDVNPPLHCRAFKSRSNSSLDPYKIPTRIPLQGNLIFLLAVTNCMQVHNIMPIRQPTFERGKFLEIRRLSLCIWGGLVSFWNTERCMAEEYLVS